MMKIIHTADSVRPSSWCDPKDPFLSVVRSPQDAASREAGMAVISNRQILINPRAS